jgi:WD40 repeat protein
MHFTRSILSILDEAPLQIYASALVFAPAQSRIRKLFHHSLPRWISQLPQVADSWPQCLQNLEGHDNFVRSVCFSRYEDFSGSTLLASGSLDGTIRIWRANTGECTQVLGGRSTSIQSVAFSPDQPTLLASGAMDRIVRIWRADTGVCLRILRGHTKPIHSVAFSRGTMPLLASGSEDNTVRVWRTDSDECERILEGHTARVTSVAFAHSHEHLLVSGSDDGTARIWCAKTGECTRILKGWQGAAIVSVAFSSSDPLLVASGVWSKIQIWHADTGDCMHVIGIDEGSVGSVAFSCGNNPLVASGQHRTIRIWRAESGKLTHLLRGHTLPVHSVAFSPGNTPILASGGQEGDVRIWRIDTDTESGNYNAEELEFGYKHDIVSSGLSSTYPYLVASSSTYGNAIRIWQADTGICTRILHQDESVRGLELSRGESPLLASISRETIWVWRTETGECTHVLRGHDNTVESIAFSHGNNPFLASGSGDGTVRIWRTDTGECKQILQGHQLGVYSVAFSGDSSILASASGIGLVQVWRADTGEYLAWVRFGHPNINLVFVPDKLCVLFDDTLHAIPIDGVGRRRIPAGEVYPYGVSTMRAMGYSRFHINKAGTWIGWRGRNLLWIPTEFRSATAIRDSTIALYNRTGAFTFMTFSPEILTSLSVPWNVV